MKAPLHAQRLVRIADAAVLAALTAALYVALAGRALVLVKTTVHLPSLSFLLFFAVAVLAIRHAAVPRPGIVTTIRRWVQRLEERPHAAAAVRAFLVTRPLVFLVGLFAVVTFGFPPSKGEVLSSEPLENLPARFDAGWYAAIALEGYDREWRPGLKQDIAFFPALPLLIRPAGALVGMNHTSHMRERRLLRALWAGVVVSLAAFGVALFYVARLSDMLTGGHTPAAATLLLASYPFAVFFSAPYTESLFLLGCVGAFYHFHRAQYVAASLFGLLVGASRPNGFLLAVPLAVLAVEPVVRAWRGGAPTASIGWRMVGGRLLVASMPVVTMLLFTVYLFNVTGVWFAWARTHAAWGRTWGTRPIAQGWEWLTTEGLMAVFKGVPYDTLNTFAAIFALLLVWPVFRRLGVAYALFALVNLVPPIFAGGALSMGRITSTIFPLFIALAAIVPSRSVPGWAAGFGILQGLVAALFFTWRELF